MEKTPNFGEVVFFIYLLRASKKQIQAFVVALPKLG